MCISKSYFEDILIEAKPGKLCFTSDEKSFHVYINDIPSLTNALAIAQNEAMRKKEMFIGKNLANIEESEIIFKEENGNKIISVCRSKIDIFASSILSIIIWIINPSPDQFKAICEVLCNYDDKQFNDRSFNCSLNSESSSKEIVDFVTEKSSIQNVPIIVSHFTFIGECFKFIVIATDKETKRSTTVIRPHIIEEYSRNNFPEDTSSAHGAQEIETAHRICSRPQSVQDEIDVNPTAGCSYW